MDTLHLCRTRASARAYDLATTITAAVALAALGGLLGAAVYEARGRSLALVDYERNGASACDGPFADFLTEADRAEIGCEVIR